jgi:hypothetical protein
LCSVDFQNSSLQIFYCSKHGPSKTTFLVQNMALQK